MFSMFCAADARKGYVVSIPVSACAREGVLEVTQKRTYTDAVEGMVAWPRLLTSPI